MISLVLSPQASQPGVNFHISELVCLIPLGNSIKRTEQPVDFIFIEFAYILGYISIVMDGPFITKFKKKCGRYTFVHVCYSSGRFIK